jgi:hypothetical protein
MGFYSCNLLGIFFLQLSIPLALENQLKHFLTCANHSENFYFDSTSNQEGSDQAIMLAVCLTLFTQQLYFYYFFIVCCHNYYLPINRPERGSRRPPIQISTAPLIA